MTALTRASVVRTLAVLAIVLIAGGNASAQSYPTKQVRMIVPFGAGGPADVFARVLAQHLPGSAQAEFHGREPARRRRDHRHRSKSRRRRPTATRCW